MSNAWDEFKGIFRDVSFLAFAGIHTLMKSKFPALFQPVLEAFSPDFRNFLGFWGFFPSVQLASWVFIQWFLKESLVFGENFTEFSLLCTNTTVILVEQKCHTFPVQYITFSQGKSLGHYFVISVPEKVEIFVYVNFNALLSLNYFTF